jgi:hypothetical protein
VNASKNEKSDVVIMQGLLRMATTVPPALLAVRNEVLKKFLWESELLAVIRVRGR